MSTLPVITKPRGPLKAPLLLVLALLLALAFALVASIAVPAPALALGTVTPLDPWPATPQMAATTGNLSGTFAVSDGIDRLVVVLVCCFDYNWNSGQSFTATYGGKVLTQAHVQNSDRRQTWIGYLKENDIASRSGDTVAVTVNGAHTRVCGYIASYAGVDQNAIVTDAGGRYIPGFNDWTIGGPLAVNEGGYAIYGWSGQSGRTRTSDNETYAENSDASSGGGGTNFNYGVASKSFAESATTDPAVTWSGSNFVSVSFVTLNPASTYPLPVATSISPTTKTVGDDNLTLTVYGANFVNGASVVCLDGAVRTTTFISTTQLTALMSASDLAAAGAKSVTVFTPTPGGGTSDAQTLTVNKATPVITWANPADILYGTALSGTQLCATASVPGTFVYAPGVGAVLSAGDGQSLHVAFTPTDTANYEATSADVTINIKKANVTITANSSSKTYGDSVLFTGNEFTAEGLARGDMVTSVTCTSSGAGTTATVAGSPYAIVPSAAMGTGLTNYNIIYVNGPLTVNQKALTITANNRTKTCGENMTFAGTEFTADGLVNGDTVTRVELTSAGAPDYAPGEGGPYHIVASGAVGVGLENYVISYVNGALTVSPAGASLTLTSSADALTQGRSVTFTATVTGTGPTGVAATGRITFLDGETVLGRATLSDGTATFSTSKLAAGNHSITAVYGGDRNFAGSTSSAVDLTVRSPGWFTWALIGWLIAAAFLGLFFFVVLYRRRRKHRPGTISRAMGIVFNDAVTGGVALSTVEEVSTYPIQIELELENSIKRVEKSMEGAILAICRTVETKDPYVSIHQKRVSLFACAIAQEMGLSAWQIEGIRVAGLLHDIGKVTIPTEILTKPGRLSRIELAMIKDHPKVAYDILKNVEFDRPVAQIVVQHHERMDGSGYPDALSGEDILLEARILAVADVVEAMCTDRPYRPALKVEDALAELARGDGKIYDPEVVRACVKVLKERGFKVELAGAST